jgi:hypothetical protein
MKLNKSMQRMVNFANWCRNHNVKPLDLAELLILRTRATRSIVANCNPGADAVTELTANNRTLDFARKAKYLGFTVEWSCAVPTVRVNGHDIHLPA